MPPQLREPGGEAARRTRKPSAERLADGLALPQPLRDARQILLCLRWGIGDLVMELPLIEALRRQLPHARITALGASPAIELLEHEDTVDRLVEVQQFGLSHWGDAGTEAVRENVRRWCRTQAVDCVLEGSHAPLGARLALEGLGLPWFDTGRHPFSAENAGDGLSLITRAAEACWDSRSSASHRG